MKFYRFCILIACFTHQSTTQAFWQKWVDAINTKIYKTTDVIVHKEFKNAKKLELFNEQGAVIITSWKQDFIAIEMIQTCAQASHKDIKIDMECLDQVVTIHTIFTDPTLKASVIFNILAPENTPIVINTKQGDISIKDIVNDLHVTTGNGNISLVCPHANINALTEHGNILIETHSIKHNKKWKIQSNKGNIDLHVSPTINTYLHAQAPEGKVTSELFITLDSITTLLNAEAWKNFKQSVHGTIGNPVSTLDLIADNGSIALDVYRA